MSDAKGSQASSEKATFSPGTFSLVYESKDKRFCLFEDKSGHLTAVRAEKLA